MGYRALLIRFFTFLGGIYFFLEFVLPERMEVAGHTVRFGAYTEQISNGFILVGAMAIGLGIINLVMIHGGKIVFRRSGWINSIALLGGMLAMVVISLRDWSATESIAAESQRFFLLRDFAQVIVRDAEVAPARPVGAGIPELGVRVDALERAAIAEIARLREKLSTGRSGDLESSSSALEIQTRRELESAVARSEVALRSGGGVEVATLDRVREIGTVLSQVGVSYRQLQLLWYERTTTKQLYQLFFSALFAALGTAMFALLGFYVATAAYRAFRIRSAESALMMVAAVVVMLGQIPFGLWIAEWLPEVRVWLLNTPSAAARRAIEIGAAVAGLVMAFRMWLSIESESFSDSGEER